MNEPLGVALAGYYLVGVYQNVLRVVGTMGRGTILHEAEDGLRDNFERLFPLDQPQRSRELLEQVRRLRGKSHERDAVTPAAAIVVESPSPGTDASTGT